ncbi:type I-E CRISPR-associated protein Cas5/CasD [Streptomyces agglomeratus]|uniref:Type I-E CRISPR-associated protein Cas5/CasD n=1 Tax=Streptomyces agglomeratus TaxID=285458 RepID=A0A1E5NYR7_9ACTN|nr:type I-E CRISPR-associated protein Cas5/CasD [Streptomyces agglomeratus]OEJ21414.1 type I-E CRISPR-associated protein Cas5/CasD [Streptomyces agglomeratus]OEJ36415.1 type I-E CRISPR-associated protein Cas5/CasD [Streptomyces agglomeratus]OEJ56564.1 type I-E CRISPR-associated protein Cas5/CasD [Streptomyces agglomeratus]
MPTCLIRLCGLMQAWGVHTPYEAHNDTLARPTKSGVIGLVCNALGYDSRHNIDNLASLHFAVRADRPGHLESDDQTAGDGDFPLDILTAARNPQLAEHPDRFRYAAPREIDPTTGASWKRNTRKTVMGNKTYIVDGSFLAGLTGPAPLIDSIHQALAQPARLPYLGRRCCPPSRPLAHGTTHHETDWPDHVPLLPNATTHHPKTWQESPNPSAAALPEQPPTTYHRRNHHNLPMTSRTTAPPAAPQEADS